MKRLIIVASISLLPILILTVWYEIYKQRPTDQPPTFDLFIAEMFFEQDDSSPFDIVSQDKKRPVKWQLNPSQFEILDTLLISLQNISGEKFYYVSWGAPFTRLRQDLIIYKNGIADTIPFDGYGCGTGIYLAPIKNDEVMRRVIHNPLMFNPYSNYDLAIESDSFPNQFKEIYGDSVAIKFSQATYSNPWSKYKSQMIFSDYIVVSTDIIIDNWKQGKYARPSKKEPTMEEHFGLKKFGQ